MATKTIKHNVSTWFKDIDFLTYFETKFKRNTMNKLVFPASVANRWDLTDEANRKRLAENLAQIYIDAVFKLKYSILKKLPFSALEETDKEYHRELICEAVQHCLYNNNVFQRINASSISTTGFAINVDSTPWLLTSDMFGQYAWNLIIISELDEYEYIGENKLFINKNNNYKIVAKIEDLTDVPSIVFDEL